MKSSKRFSSACVVLSFFSGIACSGPVAEPGDESSEVSSTHEELGFRRHGCSPCGPRHPARVTDLGHLDTPSPDLQWSLGRAVNNHKTVVGSAIEGEAPRAFRWTRRTGMVNLGTLPGGFGSSALDVNDRDEVVGRSGTFDVEPLAVLWDAQNRIRELGTLGGQTSQAFKINNRGQVVGIAETADHGDRVFMWQAETGMVELDFPENGSFTIAGFNNWGVIVGEWDQERCDQAEDCYTERLPFKWTPNQGFAQLDLSGGSGGSAVAVNDLGDIVGSIFGNRRVLVKWTRDEVVRLPELVVDTAEYTETAPVAINNAGLIVGEQRIDDPSFTVQWPTVDHVELVPIGAGQSAPLDVNDCGDIVGGFDAQAANWHAFLWESGR